MRERLRALKAHREIILSMLDEARRRNATDDLDFLLDVLWGLDRDIAEEGQNEPDEASDQTETP